MIEMVLIPSAVFVACVCSGTSVTVMLGDVTGGGYDRGHMFVAITFCF